MLQCGDPANAMMIVIEGRVKIFVSMSKGRERLLDIIEPGETFGEMALLDGRCRSADAEALDDVQAIVVEKEDFDALIAAEPAVARLLIVELCSRIRGTNLIVEDSLFFGVETRIARRIRWMTEAMKQAGSENKEPTVRGFSQQDLANAVGTSRESVNRVLRRWQSLGVVDLAHRTVVVKDKARIERISREQESTE